MATDNIDQPRSTGAAVTEAGLAAVADSVISVAALRTAGVSMHLINQRCAANGPWQRPFSRAVVMRQEPLSRRQFIRALLLHLGDGAVVTGMDALSAIGAKFDWRPDQVHVLVPSNRRVSVNHPRVIVERTTRTPPALEVEGLALAPPARACIDATRRERHRQRLQLLLLTTMRDGLCAPEELRVELDRGSQRGAAAPRALIEEVVATVASLAERRARHLVAAARLPVPQWHRALTDDDGELLTVVSAHWPELDLSWDLSQAGHHALLLTNVGRRAVHTSPSTVLRNPHGARALLESEYVAAMLDQQLSNAE